MSALLSMLLIGVASLAQPVGAAPWQEQVLLTGGHDRQRFIGGARVRVHDAQLSDLFAAGGEVVVERTSAEDAYVTGGSVRYREATFDDLTSAGGELLIAAEITDDLIAAGGRVRVESGARIDGDVVAAAGELELAGAIGGNVTAAAGRIVISGSIGGNVDLSAGEIVVDPQAHISGRLVYRSGQPARISPQSTIDGGVEHIPSAERGLRAWAGVGVAIAIVLAVAVGAMVLGVVLRALMPGPLHAALMALAARAWMSWLIGFAAIVAVPVAANIALLTVVGIPLAMVLYAAYVLALALGMVTAASFVGTLALERARVPSPSASTATKMLATSLGMLLLVLLGLIPLLGWLALLALVPAGVGAFLSVAVRAVAPRRDGALARQTP